MVGDDDMAYARTFIEDFACAVATQPANLVFSAVVDGRLPPHISRYLPYISP